MSATLVSLLLLVGGGADQSLSLDLKLSESATVALTWAGRKLGRDVPNTQHHFDRLEMPADDGLEYQIEAAGWVQRFRLPKKAASSAARVVFYMPDEVSPAADRLMLDRISKDPPSLLVLGPALQPSALALVMPELPIYALTEDPSEPGLRYAGLRFGPGSSLGAGATLEVWIDPEAPSPSFELPVRASTYVRPGSAADPASGQDVRHVLELDLASLGPRLTAYGLEGARIDEVAVRPEGFDPVGGHWKRRLGFGLAGAAFLFAVLSLVLRRQVL